MAEPAPFRLRATLALIGFTAVTAQIVLLRELLVVFDGNEMSLGLMLAAWLLWTALGSSVLGRARWGSARSVMAALQVAVAVSLPASILLVRASRRAFHALPGEVLGPAAMLAVSAAALCLFCVASGWLFAAGTRVYAEQRQTTTATAAGSVYLLEAVGAAAGGVLGGVFVPVLSAFVLALLVACMNLAAAALALPGARARRGAIAAVGLFALWSLGWAPRFDMRTSAWGWPGLRVLLALDSPYGKLTVIENQGTRTMYENGAAAFTAPDPAAAEEAAHFSMLQHQAPRRVLLIGGGLNGSAGEILKHPQVERLDYVELDPMVLELSRVFFGGEWRRLRDDPRVRMRNQDGRLFLKTTAEAYDVIVINLPDPQTAQLNRFYTVEFFREAAAKMAPAGVLALQVRGSENYISPELADFLRCLNRTLREVFAETSAVPGDTIHLFAARRPGTLARDADTLMRRLRDRGVNTEYVREYYLPFRMAPDRMQELSASLEPRASTPVNRDFTPLAYYFDVALWSGQFSAAYRRGFMALAGVSFWRLTTSILGALIAAALVFTSKRGSRQASAGWCVVAMGFTMMALEILLLLGFQAVYGYVYRQLALVIGAFMAGMALGSWRALRQSPTSANPGQMWGTQARPWRLAALQVAAAASPLALYAVLGLAAGVKSGPGLQLASYVLFPVLAVACGFLGGYQFPLAARVFYAEDEARGAGALYALDLAGACAGALVLSAYLVPVFGIGRTAALIAAANLVPAALAGFSAWRGDLRLR